MDQDEAAADMLLRGMAASATAATTGQVQDDQLQQQEVLTSSATATPEGTASDRSTDEAAATQAQSDIYRRHRRSANHLTRRWRKAVHSATVAFAAGDHSGER